MAFLSHLAGGAETAIFRQSLIGSALPGSIKGWAKGPPLALGINAAT